MPIDDTGALVRLAEMKQQLNELADRLNERIAEAEIVLAACASLPAEIPLVGAPGWFLALRQQNRAWHLFARQEGAEATLLRSAPRLVRIVALNNFWTLVDALAATVKAAIDDANAVLVRSLSERGPLGPKVAK